MPNNSTTFLYIALALQTTFASITAINCFVHCHSFFIPLQFSSLSSTINEMKEIDYFNNVNPVVLPETYSHQQSLYKLNENAFAQTLGKKKGTIESSYLDSKLQATSPLLPSNGLLHFCSPVVIVLIIERGQFGEWSP